jgi:CDP-2,3-bis-(O-geranylgeranyl)-sn-glycerol synthase
MRHIKEDPSILPADLKKVKIYVLTSSILLLLYFLAWIIIYSLLDALIAIGLAFFVLVPAFFANGLMVLTGKFKGIKPYPIDGGRVYKDGKRILGDGKTWNGFFGGWFLGFIASSLICWWFFNRIGEAVNYGPHGFYTAEIIADFLKVIMNDQNHVNYPKYFLSQAVIALGSPIGDAIGSFFKRRTSLKRGEVFLFWDQNDFVIVAASFALFFFQFYWYYWVFLLLITPLFTALANYVGYLVDVKDVPW